MTAAFRAAASVLMLLGFYVVALLQLGAVTALVVWISARSNAGIGLKLGFPLLLAVGATVVGLWKAVRTRPEPPGGLLLAPADAPRLFDLIRDVAGQVGVRVPDEVRLVPEVNAAVSEDTRLLGLIGGTRRLYLGMPLLLAFSVDQLRSVIAHELGHYSGQHTRLGAVAYRGRLAIAGTISRIGRWNPVGWVFRGYARLYRLVDNAASRRQEREADRASVRVAGPVAAASALRELPVIDAAWNFYFEAYVESGWTTGLAPDDFFGGFAHLIEGRGEELDKIRRREPEQRRTAWDTHPSIAERIAVMAEAGASAHRPDDRPAMAVFAEPATVTRRLQAEVLDVRDREVLPWPEFTARALTAGDQERADQVFRAVARRTGVDQPGVATILDLVAAGRLPEVAAEFFPDAGPAEAPLRFADVMDNLLTLAAIRSGAARWQHSWSGPATLVDAAGVPLDLAEVAKLAVQPETVDVARARLAELGVRVEAAGLVEERLTGRGAEVMAALANVKVGEEHADLILLDRGLVLVPAPKKTDKGEKRLVELLRAHSAEELASAHRFVPYEEISGVTITKRTPIRFEATLHGGGSLSVHERWDGEQIGKSREALLNLLTQLGGR